MARLNRNREEEGTERLPSPTSVSVVIPPIPEVTTELINYLNAMFPNTLPPEGSPYSALERAWGKREVVDHLTRIKEQNEESNHVLQQQQTRSGADPGTAPGTPR